MPRGALLVLAAIVLAGCGGSHSSSGGSKTSSTPASKVAATSVGSEGTYRAQVNAICAVFNKQMQAINLSNQRTVAALAVVQRAAVAQIRRVKPPSSLAAPVGGWLHSAEAAVAANAEVAKALKKNPNASVQNTRAGIAYVDGAHAAFAKAEALGLRSCAVVGAI